MNLNYIYTAISWLLLRWHDLWDAILPGGRFLATDWQWILAIVFLVVTIRVVLFPLFIKQIKSQRAMQAISPQIKELQAKHKGDRETLQREMMELYKKEKANPLMGCLPLLLQAPVFIGLLHVLRRVRPDNVKPENFTLYTWTEDQWFSALDAKVFGAPIWGTFLTPDDQLVGVTSGLNVKVVSGILVAIMIVTTYFTSRQMILKTGWNEDPQQRMIQKLMLYGIPVMLLFSGGIFPIGVILYWVINNGFSLGQQIWVLRKYPPPKNTSTAAAAKKKVAAKPGSKKYAEELKAKQERAKALAPKAGAKPSNKKKGGATRGASK